MECGEAAWSEARQTLSRLLSDKEGVLRDNEELKKRVLYPQASPNAALVCVCEAEICRTR